MLLSARRLGEKIYLTAEEMNVLLKKKGFLQGEPGNYSLTELGKKYAEIKTWENGYGGYAARSYEYICWKEEILKILKLDSQELDEIRNLTKKIRLERKIKVHNCEFIPKSQALQKNYINFDNKKIYIISGLAFITILMSGYIIYRKKYSATRKKVV